MDTSKSISAWHMINMHYRPCIENVEFQIIIKIRPVLTVLYLYIHENEVYWAAGWAYLVYHICNHF